MRQYCLPFATFFAGMFSAPTPDQFSFFEVAISLFLIMYVVTSKLEFRYRRKISENLMFYSKKWWLYILIFPPSLVGFLYGNDLNPIIRDVVPMLFMLLFVFSNRNQKTKLDILVLGIISMGVFYSIRFLLLPSVNLSSIGGATQWGSRDYFPQDPSVLFASVMLLNFSYYWLRTNKLLLSGMSIILFFIPYFALLIMGVRSGVILPVLALMVFILFKERYHFVKYFISVGIVFVLYHLLGVGAFDSIIDKFVVFGFNNKDNEVNDVLAHFSKYPLTIFFGQGWGGSFYSSIYDAPSRYVHNIFFYFWFKCGLVGLTFSIYLFYTVFIKNIRPFLKDAYSKKFLLKYCAIVALIPSFLVQPTYKSLSFGCLVAIIFIIRENRYASKNMHNNP